jgi:hypothetical protein
MISSFRRGGHFSLIAVSVFLFYASQVCCFAAVKDIAEDIPDDYLGTEFPWAMILDLPDVGYYLNYPGSKLWPLTKVRVNLRTYSPANNREPPIQTLYEDLWYHNQSPIGLRRYNEISISRQSYGALIVCPGNNTGNTKQRAQAIADAITRLSVDIHFRNASTGLVLVPEDEYDTVADALGQFGFVAAGTNPTVQPMNLHLRAYPEGADEFFYIQQ